MSRPAGAPRSPAGIAGAVRAFYERYPYPRPVGDLEGYRRRWDDRRRRTDHYLFWPGRPYRDDHSILVAGCGTSQAAKHALRWPAARVVGIDFSAGSVRHTEDLKRRHGLSNLEVRLLPLEHVGDLGETFDQVVCTGVLHHLADPGAGLRALRAVLQPGGAVHLMVYAPYGRAGIYMLQEFCRRVGLRADDQDVRDLVGALAALPPGHPLETLLRHAPDFRSEAALADALLHPQDRAYSVPQLLDLLQKEGLSFGRWVRQAPYSARCGVMAQIPQAPRLRRLPLYEQFAAVELFRGTMVRHSLIAYRDDDLPASRAVSFADNRWLEYTPMRLPDALCIKERLPPGAAAVLLNRAHSYTDIVLPVTAGEKALFDAVDGVRNGGDIVREALPGADPRATLDGARALFERLWWHDLIVFDTQAKADRREMS